MAGDEGSPWLRTYLETNFEDLRSRLTAVDDKVDTLGDRVTRLEASHSESRRFWAALPAWLQLAVAAVVGGLAGWRTGH